MPSAPSRPITLDDSPVAAELTPSTKSSRSLGSTCASNTRNTCRAKAVGGSARGPVREPAGSDARANPHSHRWSQGFRGP